MQRFCEANFARISNKSGFLMGIIRRIQTDGPDRGSGDLDELPRSVRYRLRDLMDEVDFPAFCSAIFTLLLPPLLLPASRVVSDSAPSYGTARWNTLFGRSAVLINR